MPIEPHSKLLTNAAREVLRPLGLRQRGRSRTWIDDRGWWLGIVEFQPSSRLKGAYLNVGAMWLWNTPRDYLTFDVPNRVEGFTEYISDEQFRPEADRLATLAAQEIARLRETLRNLDAAVSWLRDDSAERPGWPHYHLGIALGLSGQTAAAIHRLSTLAHHPDDPAWWQDAVRRAHHFAEMLDRDASTFHTEIQNQIAGCRAALKLQPNDRPTGLS